MGVSFLAELYGEGPLHEVVSTWIHARGLTDFVSLRGQGDSRCALQDAHVLLHSSDTEGTANVLLEAMAVGRPVVATRVGDAARYIRDGEAGFVVKPGDFEAMALHLADLARVPGMIEEMGRAARRVAEQNFSPHDFVDRNLAIYRSLGIGAI